MVPVWCVWLGESALGRFRSWGARTPCRQQESKVCTIDDAVAVQIGCATTLALEPAPKQDPQVRPVDDAIKRQIAHAITDGVTTKVGPCTADVWSWGVVAHIGGAQRDTWRPTGRCGDTDTALCDKGTIARHLTEVK